MRVRVKEGKTGFIYGRRVSEFKELTLKPVKHSTLKGDDGKPLVITVEKQFSKVWMEKVDDVESKAPAKMKVNELKAALIEADVDFSDTAKKDDLIVLLEEYLELEELSED